MFVRVNNFDCYLTLFTHGLWTHFWHARRKQGTKRADHLLWPTTKGVSMTHLQLAASAIAIYHAGCFNVAICKTWNDQVASPPKRQNSDADDKGRVFKFINKIDKIIRNKSEVNKLSDVLHSPCVICNLRITRNTRFPFDCNIRC